MALNISNSNDTQEDPTHLLHELSDNEIIELESNNWKRKLTPKNAEISEDSKISLNLLNAYSSRRSSYSTKGLNFTVTSADSGFDYINDMPTYREEDIPSTSVRNSLSTSGISSFDQHSDGFLEISSIKEILADLNSMDQSSFTYKRINTERNLLIAECQLDLPKETDDTFVIAKNYSTGYVTLSDIKLWSNDWISGRSKEYYVLILHCGSYLISSQIIERNFAGFTLVDEQFKFADLPVNFEIEFKIYSLKVEKRRFQNLRNFFSKCTGSDLSETIRNKSAFALVGSTKFTISEFKNGLRYYQTFASNGRSETDLYVKLSTQVDISVKCSGFLDVARRTRNACPIWNRRWCMLEGTKFMYWTSPTDCEQNLPPIDTFDLFDCLAARKAKKEEGLRKISFVLEFEFREYCCLSMLKWEQFLYWKVYFDIVMKEIRKWKGK